MTEDNEAMAAVDTVEQVSPEILSKRLDLYMELYKHHFDLFLKGFALYVAVVGTLAGFLFGDGTSVEIRNYMASAISIGSLVTMVACSISFIWIRRIDQDMRELSERIRLEPVPLFGPKGIFLIMLIVSTLCAVTGFWFWAS